MPETVNWRPPLTSGESSTLYDRTWANAHAEDRGVDPHLLSGTLIESLFEITKRYAHRVRPEALLPTINWRHPAPGT